MDDPMADIIKRMRAPLPATNYIGGKAWGGNGVVDESKSYRVYSFQQRTSDDEPPLFANARRLYENPEE